MAQTPINIEALIAAVDRAVGLQESAAAFITNSGELMKKAVADALAADDAADQGSIDAANAAIDAVVAKQTASSDKLADALASTPA
jgi:hypothetical protein